MTNPILLPDLMTLTAASIAPAEKVLETATTTLRAMVTKDDRVSAGLVEANQSAVHGLSWLATYVEALRQMQAWAERIQGDGKFGEIEQLILQIGFGEYLHHIAGGGRGGFDLPRIDVFDRPAARDDIPQRRHRVGHVHEADVRNLRIRAEA